MPKSSTVHRGEFIIVGSGFAGSLLAWILARAGREVCLVDRSAHPRFAIGESSTPLADFLLEHIGREFDLPEVLPMCRWGSWQQQLPQLRAGKKRGFSYFAHQPGREYCDQARQHSFLVAASENDPLSDTHWMRSDVDHWFARHAQAAGAQLWEKVEGLRVEPDHSANQLPWRITFNVTGQFVTQHGTTVIDASGAGAVMGRQLGLNRLGNRMRVNTAALFGHFSGVKPWAEVLQLRDYDARLDPFNVDDAAQHHLLDGAWMWMLRFAGPETSVGIVGPARLFPDLQNHSDSAIRSRVWQAWLERYPDLRLLLEEATLIDPAVNGRAQLGWHARISRLWERGSGNGWLMLPGTVGVVDPLHSTGIAHALSGVGRCARLLLAKDDRHRQTAWDAYGQEVVDEVLWIDRIVACCYLAARDSFELFVAVCSIYFVAAIECERLLAASATQDHGFLLVHDPAYVGVVTWLESALEQLARSNDRPAARRKLVADLRNKLQPWNDVGLLDPECQNRLARTSAPK